MLSKKTKYLTQLVDIIVRTVRPVFIIFINQVELVKIVTLSAQDSVNFILTGIVDSFVIFKVLLV